MKNKSLNIGICTHPLIENYGGILQNYALQTALKRMGHKVWTFDISKFTWSEWLYFTCRIFVHKLLGHHRSFIPTPLERKKYEDILRRFAYNNISLMKPRTRWFDKRMIKKYAIDLLVVGSDQTWRPKYVLHLEDFFLAFADNTSLGRISYAASFGTDKWEYTSEQEMKCAALAKKFSAISVREKSGVMLCKQHLKVEAAHVLDPTFLLMAGDYVSLCKHIPCRKPFLFAYILDKEERKIDFIKKIAGTLQLPYIIAHVYDEMTEMDSVENWLSYFRDATFVITDSFHGAAFSINFNKDFYVFCNEKRGNSRIESLMETFHLEKRVISNEFLEPQTIDWDSVNKVLELERINSKNWLEKAIIQLT